MYYLISTEEFFCKTCNKMLTNPESLLRHNRTYHSSSASTGGIAAYQCSTCGKSLSSLQGLKRHETKFHNSAKNSLDINNSKSKTLKLTFCDVCERPFYGMKSMKVHRISHMNQEEKMLLLASSETTTNSEDAKYLFMCPMCNKSFSSEHMLKVHENIHLGTKPFVCEICDKVSQLANLNSPNISHLQGSFYV